MYTLFDSFFAPPTIVVVSEERLKAAELKAKQKQLLEIKVRIEQLQEFYDKLDNEVKALKPAEGVNAKAGKDLDKLDEATCDV